MKPIEDPCNAKWPPLPSFSANAFKGTARCHAEFRPPYPVELFRNLMGKIVEPGNSMFLDLGSGPGRVTFALMPYFAHTYAVDPEVEMIEEGRRRTPLELKDRISWIQSSAEDFIGNAAGFHLVTIGEAFHRMDQRTVAVKIRAWLKPGGCIAILGYEHIWHGTEDWKQAVCDVLDEYKQGPLSTVSDALVRESVMTFEDVLRATGFQDIESRDYREHRIWSTDELLGYLYSVSIFSKKNLGIRAAAFERDVRRALRFVDSSRKYAEDSRFQCLSALTPK